MAKAVAKKQKVGWALEINRTGETGADKWEGVGFIFGSRYEAQTYKTKHYPNVAKARIVGVRISAEKLRAPSKNDLQEKGAA